MKKTKNRVVGSVLHNSKKQCSCGNYCAGQETKCIQCQAKAITKRNYDYQKLCDKKKFK